MPDTHIRVSEENWQRLNSKKKPGDTFDDVIDRLISEPGESGDDG